MPFAATERSLVVPPSKRIFDVVLSAVLIILALPLMAVVALGVKVSSSGTIFYQSERRGLNGKPFLMIKFRSMCLDADLQQDKLESLAQPKGVLFKIFNDPRATKLGRWIRRSSIDELPQLWNVLKGDMSLVGPRPLPERDYQLLGQAAHGRCAVLPGMTGLWQVSGRSNLASNVMIQLDQKYIYKQSFALDCYILLRTIPAVITGRGAF